MVLIKIKCDPIPPPTSLTNVCLVYAQSARNKVDVLTGYINEKELDITVTWLKDGDNAMTKDLPPDGFSIYSVNTKLKTGGGGLQLFTGMPYFFLSSLLIMNTLNLLNIYLVQ